MRKIIQNKRADIPVMILVLGVFLICIFVIGNFFISESKIKRNFSGINLIDKMNFEIEKYSIYKSAGKFSEEEIDTLLNVKKDIQGRYLYLEDNKKDVGFSVKYYLPG